TYAWRSTVSGATLDLRYSSGFILRVLENLRDNDTVSYREVDEPRDVTSCCCQNAHFICTLYIAHSTVQKQHNLSQNKHHKCEVYVQRSMFSNIPTSAIQNIKHST